MNHFDNAKVIGVLATQYLRRAGLARVVNDVLQQVDELHIYLNDYPETYYTDWMQDYKRIFVHRAHTHWGDLADNGKFILNPVNYPGCFITTFDDDLFYSNNHVAKLKKECAKYNMFGERAVVSVHGCVLHNTMTNYYVDRTVYPHNEAVPVTMPVHVVGTGCMMFFADHFQYSPELFIRAEKRMSDIIFSAEAMKAGLKRYVIAHNSDFLRINLKEATKDSIMLRLRYGNEHIVKYISERAWWR